MFVSVGAWRPCSMRLIRVKCCPVAAARACPVSPAARRSWRRRAPSSRRAWVTELLGSVVTGGGGQVPDRLEGVPTGVHDVGVTGGLEGGVGAGAGVVQEQCEGVVEDVEVAAS